MPWGNLRSDPVRRRIHSPSWAIATYWVPGEKKLTTVSAGRTLTR
ncbi:hypothetical protein [Micromonospora sp. RTGN7]|nr:hypothetical protein [Micromonospora sp. RTGN7]